MSRASPGKPMGEPGAEYGTAAGGFLAPLRLHVNNSELTSVSKHSYQDSLDSWDWEKIPADVDQVVVRWWAMVRGRTPWRTMPTDDGCGYVRTVVSELLNEARHPRDGMRELRLRAAARAHGEFRRRQRCDCTTLTDELAALSAAIEAAMLFGGQSPGLVRDYLVVLDADVEVAREYALKGWSAGDHSMRPTS
jgi:hypothetical protein